MTIYSITFFAFFSADRDNTPKKKMADHKNWKAYRNERMYGKQHFPLAWLSRLNSLSSGFGLQSTCSIHLITQWSLNPHTQRLRICFFFVWHRSFFTPDILFNSFNCLLAIYHFSVNQPSSLKRLFSVSHSLFIVFHVSWQTRKIKTDCRMYRPALQSCSDFHQFCNSVGVYLLSAFQSPAVRLWRQFLPWASALLQSASCTSCGSAASAIFILLFLSISDPNRRTAQYLRKTY